MNNEIYKDTDFHHHSVELDYSKIDIIKLGIWLAYHEIKDYHVITPDIFVKKRVYYFHSEEDALLFKMRWL